MLGTRDESWITLNNSIPPSQLRFVLGSKEAGVNPIKLRTKRLWTRHRVWKSPISSSVRSRGRWQCQLVRLGQQLSQFRTEILGLSYFVKLFQSIERQLEGLSHSYCTPHRTASTWHHFKYLINLTSLVINSLWESKKLYFLLPPKHLWRIYVCSLQTGPYACSTLEKAYDEHGVRGVGTYFTGFLPRIMNNTFVKVFLCVIEGIDRYPELEFGLEVYQCWRRRVIYTSGSF